MREWEPQRTTYFSQILAPRMDRRLHLIQWAKYWLPIASTLARHVVPNNPTVFIAASGIQAAIDSSSPGAVLQFSGEFFGNVDVNRALTLGGAFDLDGSLTVSAPGATLDAGFSPGTIASGSLALTSGSTLTANVNGTTPGSEHDQYIVTGSVSLGGATLDAFGTITSAPGDTIVLIDNDLADPVTGTFAGLANGDIVSINAQDFVLFYDGGNGNDVVLVAPPATSTVYVDDDWTGTANGADPDGMGPATAFGLNAFDNITDALAAVSAGGTVYVFDGSYNESVALTQDVSLVADTIGGADVNAGAATGVTVAPGVSASISGFDFSGFFSTGIASQGDLLLENSSVAGGFTGVIANGGVVTVTGSTISGAAIFGVEVTSGGQLIADLTEITANGTAGVIVSNGSANVQQSIVGNNSRGIIVTAAGSAVVAGSNLAGNAVHAIENAAASPVDASGNWWGSASELDVQSATSGLVDFSPFLDAGTDTNGIATGFVGDFSALHVTELGQQVGGGRIQEGVDLATAAGTVTVGDGNYNETAIVDKPLTLEAATKFDRDTLTPSGVLIAPTTGTQQTVLTIAAPTSPSTAWGSASIRTTTASVLPSPRLASRRPRRRRLISTACCFRMSMSVRSATTVSTGLARRR